MDFPGLKDKFNDASLGNGWNNRVAGRGGETWKRGMSRREFYGFCFHVIPTRVAQTLSRAAVSNQAPGTEM